MDAGAVPATARRGCAGRKEARRRLGDIEPRETSHRNATLGDDDFIVRLDGPHEPAQAGLDVSDARGGSYAIALSAATPAAVARPAECKREDREHRCANVCALATRTDMLQEPSDKQKAQRPENEESARQPERDRHHAQHVCSLDRPPRAGICPGGYTQFAGVAP